MCNEFKVSHVKGSFLCYGINWMRSKQTCISIYSEISLFSHLRACLPPQLLWIQHYYVKPSYVLRSMSNSAYYFQCSYWIQILLNRLFPLSMRKQTFAFPKKNIVFVKWGSNFPTKPSLQGFLLKWLMNAYCLPSDKTYSTCYCYLLT